VSFAKTGSGKFEFPKLGKVVLSHIGPGVFFALFGSGILVFGLLQATKYEARTTFDSMPMVSFDSLPMVSFPPADARRKKVLSELDDLKKLVVSRGDADDAKKVEQIIANIKGYVARYEFYINREAAGPDPRLPGS
jgi:hypothetical protein